MWKSSHVGVACGEQGAREVTQEDVFGLTGGALAYGRSNGRENFEALSRQGIRWSLGQGVDHTERRA
jgi:hypothetical protein